MVSFLMGKKYYLVIAALMLLSAGLFLLLPGGLLNPSRLAAHELKDYVILIQVDEKKLYLLNYGQTVKKYTIATGMELDFPSPVGDWEITYKSRNWGGGFGDRWMGLNVPWGSYGIHGTNDEGRIGDSVSHGCIRMRNRDVTELYDLVDVGTPVIIRNGPFGPFGTGFRTLIPGDRGADVLAVQRRLRELGYFNGEPSGIYGEETKDALHRFQRDHGLTAENEITHEDYLAMGFLEFE